MRSNSYSKEEDEAIFKMKRLGLSTREIADGLVEMRLGPVRTQKSVQYRMRYLGIAYERLRGAGRPRGSGA